MLDLLLSVQPWQTSGDAMTFSLSGAFSHAGFWPYSKQYCAFRFSRRSPQEYCTLTHWHIARTQGLLSMYWGLAGYADSNYEGEICGRGPSPLLPCQVHDKKWLIREWTQYLLCLIPPHADARVVKRYIGFGRDKRNSDRESLFDHIWKTGKSYLCAFQKDRLLQHYEHRGEGALGSRGLRSLRLPQHAM